MLDSTVKPTFWSKRTVMGFGLLEQGPLDQKGISVHVEDLIIVFLLVQGQPETGSAAAGSQVYSNGFLVLAAKMLVQAAPLPPVGE